MRILRKTVFIDCAVGGREYTVMVDLNYENSCIRIVIVEASDKAEKTSIEAPITTPAREIYGRLKGKAPDPVIAGILLQIPR